MKRAILAVVAWAFALVGCGSMPTPPADGPGCQVRAGYAMPEGAVNGGIGSTSIAGVGAAATVIGECPPEFKTFARGAGGSIVCVGSDEWCSSMAANQPVPVTVEQLRQLVEEAAP